MAQNLVILFGGQSPEHEVSISSFSGVTDRKNKAYIVERGDVLQVFKVMSEEYLSELCG